VTSRIESNPLAMIQEAAGCVTTVGSRLSSPQVEPLTHSIAGSDDDDEIVTHSRQHSDASDEVDDVEDQKSDQSRSTSSPAVYSTTADISVFLCFMICYIRHQLAV
jgi:hypothetical protein